MDNVEDEEIGNIDDDDDDDETGTNFSSDEDESLREGTTRCSGRDCCNFCKRVIKSERVANCTVGLECERPA